MAANYNFKISLYLNPGIKDPAERVKKHLSENLAPSVYQRLSIGLASYNDNTSLVEVRGSGIEVFMESVLGYCRELAPDTHAIWASATNGRFTISMG